MPPSSQLRRRHHRHTGDRGLHAHVQPPHGSSVRMEEGRAFLQAAEGQACCSSATAISRLRNTGNYDPDEVLAKLRLKPTSSPRGLKGLGWHHRRVIHPCREAPTMPVPSVATILRDHVSLSTSSIDRLYLNGYVP